MRNDDANQAMMMGADAVVTIASCANNAVSFFAGSGDDCLQRE